MSMNTSMTPALARTAPAQDDQSIAVRARQKARQRRISVYGGQLLVLVVFLGTWQLLGYEKVIDPFFFGTPLGIVERLEGRRDLVEARARLGIPRVDPGMETAGQTPVGSTDVGRTGVVRHPEDVVERLLARGHGCHDPALPGAAQ